MSNWHSLEKYLTIFNLWLLSFPQFKQILSGSEMVGAFYFSEEKKYDAFPSLLPPRGLR